MSISPKIAEGLYLEEKCSENVLEHDDCNIQPTYVTCVCLHDMLPKVQKKLNDAGYDLLLINIFQVILMNQMSLNNIALLLSVDTVRWYTLEASSQMAYGYEIKLWW